MSQQTVPGKPSVEGSSHNIKVSWSAPTGSKEDIASYKIQLWHQENNSPIDNFDTDDNSTNWCVAIDSSFIGKILTVRVQAIAGCTEGPVSEHSDPFEFTRGQDESVIFHHRRYGDGCRAISQMKMENCADHTKEPAFEDTETNVENSSEKEYISHAAYTETVSGVAPPNMTQPPPDMMALMQQFAVFMQSYQPQPQPQPCQMPKPDPPVLLHSSDGNMCLTWAYPVKWESFEIYLRKEGDLPWNMMTHDDKAMKHSIFNLIPGQKYEIKLRAISNFMISDFSDMVTTEVPHQAQKAEDSPPKPKTTEPPDIKKHPKINKPDAPELDHATIDKLKCCWYINDDSDIEKYEIQYRVKDEEDWKKEFTENKTREYTLENLQSNTKYEIRLRGMAGGVPGPFCKAMFCTKETLLHKVIHGAKVSKAGTPSTYKIPLTHMSKNEEMKVQMVEYGERTQINVPEKTLMMVGATGVGKSTLINGIANYVFGVQWEDNCRLEIVDTTTERGHTQALSQTEYITCYKIHHMRGSTVPCTLNIIDTPGFGDTSGVDQDNILLKQIRYLFSTKGDKGVQCIDAICFVTIASQARLTATQRYIMDSVLAVFGEDIKNNICVLITFADGSVPEVLPALNLANFPFANHFCFNNSALYQSNIEPAPKVTHIFWQMGQTSFEQFFTEIANMSTKSLQLSAQVLEERHGLEATVAGLQTRLSEKVEMLGNLHEEQKILDANKQQIEENKNFSFTTKVIVPKRVPNVPSMNCKTCNRTCFRVDYVNNQKVLKPIAETMAQLYQAPRGTCPLCRHEWALHQEMNFLVEVNKKLVKKTHEELKNKYVTAFGEKNRALTVIDGLKNEIQGCEETILNLAEIMTQKNNQLKKIALKENPLTHTDYIDLLIQQEKGDLKEGFQHRIDALLKVRNRAKILGQAVGGDFQK